MPPVVAENSSIGLGNVGLNKFVVDVDLKVSHILPEDIIETEDKPVTAPTHSEVKEAETSTETYRMMVLKIMI